ncbi:MAG: hypothetical protein GX616_13280 [Planctomycetes bacterium]|nr:hypothetical protein [Planctomycetota bacterium]
MTTNANDKIRLDADLRAFLRECRKGQCLAIAAWATKVLRAGEMTMADLERCLNLGFEF